MKTAEILVSHVYTDGHTYRRVRRILRVFNAVTNRWGERRVEWVRPLADMGIGDGATGETTLSTFARWATHERPPR